VRGGMRGEFLFKTHSTDTLTCPPPTQARAYFDVKPEDIARTVVLGRSSNNPHGPVSIGEPRIVLRSAGDLRSTAFGMSPYDYHSRIKDLFWYVEKAYEGTANSLNILSSQALDRNLIRVEQINLQYGAGAITPEKANALGKLLVWAFGSSLWA
jgi:hypothetical protein